MAPPKPKPRKELAQAAAAASKWAFGTPGLSAKNLAAARKNYDYIQERLRQTGGELTDVETGIGKRHKTARAKQAQRKLLVPPPSKFKPGDPEYSSSARLDIRDVERATKAFTGPEKQRGARILKELERQGYAKPQTNQQAQAQVKQLVKKLSGSTREINKQIQADAIRKATPPPAPKSKWLGAASSAADWAVPERVERWKDVAEAETMGVTPGFLKPALRNLKEITADVAMSVPVIGESIYNDFTGKTHLAIPRMAKDMLVGWGQGIEAATPLPKDLRKTLGDVAHGRWDDLGEDAKNDFKRMAEEWHQRPFTAILNLYPAVSAAGRAASFPGLARQIARANPQMGRAAVLRAARKESYVPGAGAARLARGKPGKPGWKGGIPDRILTQKIVHPETGEVLKTTQARARPPSRSDVGRRIQGRYDRWSASDGPLSPGRIPGLGKFTELHRANVAINKGRALESDLAQVKLLQQMEPIESYIRQSGLGNKAKNALLGRIEENRSRLSETYWGPQGPSKIDIEDTMQAVATDLEDIARTGGLDVPSNKLVAIDKELRQVRSRLESLGPSVHLDQGLWAQATNTMRQAGYTQPMIEMNLNVAAQVARAWAKREPGRNPDDWLGSEEGRNIANFQFGSPPEAALDQSLFQVLYPGDKDIKEYEGNPYRDNRVAYQEQLAAHQARIESGELPADAPFDSFDPPHKTAYRLTPDSQKSKMAQEASEALDRTTDVRTGEMLPDADPLEYERVAKALPREAKTAQRSDGKEIHSGRTTLDMKRENAEAFFDTLTPEQQELFARWYERVWDYVAYLYGPEKMRKMGDAFFASQAAQSPSGGIANLFRVAEDIQKGKPVPSGANQWLQRNIHLLMRGKDLGEDPSGLAAKLMDFMDSGLGMMLRTIMRELSDVGPGVVDRWTWRSDGYYPKFDGKEGGMVSRNIKGGIEADDFLSTDRGGAIAYEYSSKRLQLLTDEWNRAAYKGRTDWTVDQVQAIDWFATKKRWVEDGLTPKSAEGGSPLDMALDNTREIVFHGSPTELKRAARQTGAGVRIVSGVSRTGEGLEFSRSPEGVTHAIVAGSGPALDRLRMTLGETGQTVSMRYPGSMGGTSTARSHQIDIERDRRGAASDAVRHKLKKGQEPNLYSMGEDVYRLDFGHGTTALKRAEAVADALGIPKNKIVSRFTESSGMPEDILYDYRRMEKAIKKAEADRMKADVKAEAKEAKAAKAKGRPVRPIKGRERGEATEAMLEHLDSLKERLGLRDGDTPTDDQILDLANELVKETRGKPEVLHQRTAEGIAGAVQFLDGEGGRQILYMSEHANPSTFAHELFGHAAHEMKREFPAEFAKVEKRYGKELQDWERAEHERLASDMEKYLMKGKAPTPELEPAFAAMKRWMYTVYETIKALGRPIDPETKKLFDRYFGREPLDFTPPQRLRRTGKNAFPPANDVAGINDLVDRTANLLLRGVENLKNDPKARTEIAGSMKWLEEQVLPFVAELDSALSTKVHDLFNSFDETKAGDSIFNPDERRLLRAQGELLRMRHSELENIAGKLRSQPDHSLLAAARNVMEAADDPEMTLEQVRDLVKDIGQVSREMRMRTKGDEERKRWLNRTVRDIERAIDPDRKQSKKSIEERNKAQNAMRDISEIMTGIYLDTFGENLSPVARKNLADTLQARDDVIPTRLRELGLLDEGVDVQGHGAYVPHYSVFDKVFSRLRGPVRLPAAGGNRKILSMNQRMDQTTFGKGPNKLVRYGTGELQVDPRTLLSAFRQRLRFVETKMLREQLFQMGAKIPVDPDTGVPRIPEGWYILNGSGKSVPERLRRWQDASPKERDELLASGEDFDSMLQTEGGTVKMLEEYRDSFLSKKGETQKSLDGWVADGTSIDDLRMLPQDVVETLVGKVFESQPGGFWGSAFGMIGTAGRVATIFSHPMGYIQANVAANGILLMLTNPSRAPRAVLEFFGRGPAVRASDPNFYGEVISLTGDVQASAGIPTAYVKAQTKMENVERMAAGTTSTWAAWLGKWADHPFRFASWTGHARKYGFDDVEGWKELARSTDPEIVKIREIVSQRARDDMLDFNKLSAAEQRLTRVLFIYPFIRAAVAQPAWLLREYPARVAAMSQVANAQQSAYGEGDPLAMKDKYEAVAPAADRSMFDLNDIPFAGGTVAMGTVNPLGPFTEKISDLNTVLTDPNQIGRIAAAQINPAFAAMGQGSFGYGGMDWEKVLGSTVPGAAYVMAAMSAKKRGAQKYTDRDSFWDYLRRRDALRIWPENVDPEEVREKAKEDAEKLDKRPAWEKAHEEDKENVDKTFAAAEKKMGRPVSVDIKSKVVRSINAYNALDQYEDAMKDELGVDELTESQRLDVTEKVVREFFPRDAAAVLRPREEVERLPVNKRGTSNDQEGYRQMLRDEIQYWRSQALAEGRDLGVVKD